jgi:hypothetical protein
MARMLAQDANICFALHIIGLKVTEKIHEDAPVGVVLKTNVVNTYNPCFSVYILRLLGRNRNINKKVYKLPEIYLLVR